MNFTKNALRAFTNAEMAEIKITYCAVDNEFTASLSYLTESGRVIKEFVDVSIDRATGDLVMYVYNLRGEK